MISNRLRELLGVVYVLKQHLPALKMCPDFLVRSACAVHLQEKHTQGTVAGDLKRGVAQQPPLFTRVTQKKKGRNGSSPSSFNVLYEMTPEGEEIGREAAAHLTEAEMVTIAAAYFGDRSS